jgi:hypothetical protein
MTAYSLIECTVPHAQQSATQEMLQYPIKIVILHERGGEKGAFPP